MATIKSYTDISQSKKLEEILPLESADMWYHGHYSPWDSERIYDKEPASYHSAYPQWDKSCWSLAALLGVLPDDCGIDKEDGKYVASYIISNECDAYTKDNSIDACVAMIERLHELNLL